MHTQGSPHDFSEIISRKPAVACFPPPCGVWIRALVFAVCCGKEGQKMGWFIGLHFGLFVYISCCGETNLQENSLCCLL